jgi:hypothetical protein
MLGYLVVTVGMLVDPSTTTGEASETDVEALLRKTLDSQIRTACI